MDHLDQPSTNGVPTPKIVIQRFGSTMDHLDHNVDIWLANVDIWLKNVHLAYDVPTKTANQEDRKAAALPTASAAGAGRRPAYPCAGLSARARTTSQAPLGWGRVPPCTGPRRAGLPESSFPLSRSFQYISPQLARAIVQRTFKAVLLIASLPRKGIDKEAGRSARAPAPEVALLLPAQAQSGAPLRASLPVCSGLASACILQRGRPLTPKPPLPVLMRRMPREEGAQGKGHLVRASADGWLPYAGGECIKYTISE